MALLPGGRTKRHKMPRLQRFLGIGSCSGCIPGQGLGHASYGWGPCRVTLRQPDLRGCGPRQGAAGERNAFQTETRLKAVEGKLQA